MATVDTLKELSIKRGRVKSKVTRFQTYIEQNIFETEQQIQNLKSRIEKFDNILEEFENVQDSYETVAYELKCSDDEANTLEREEFEDRFHDLVSKSNLIVLKFESVQNTCSNVSQNASSSGLLKVKLPQLVIKEFHGGYDQWTQFYDSYKSLIHDNQSLSKIEKFHYLIGILKGDAAKAIRLVQITEANYDTAIDILKKRYDNKKAIINAHLKSILFEMPNVKAKSHASLRNLLDNFMPNYRALENLGENIGEWSSILICLITSKLDIKLKSDWENSIVSKQTPLTTEDLINFLNERCAFLESCDNDNSNSKRENPKSVHTVQSNPNIKPKFNCLICSEAHPIFSCPKFKALSIDAKYEEVKRLRLCTNCLRPGHQNANCISGGCRKCNKKHNTLIHRSYVDRNIDQRVSEVASAPGAAENTSLVGSLQNVSMELSASNSQVILSTVIVKVQNKKGDFIKCRALLDSGSQINLISSSLFDKLGINYQSVSCPITGINNISSKASKKLNFNIFSNVNSFSTNLTFFVISSIANNTPITSININNFHVPANTTLADEFFDQGLPIDMLLGAGVFYELLCVGQIKMGRNAPLLQKTRFGWIVAGNIQQQKPNFTNSCFITMSSLNSQIEQFWRIEETPMNKKAHLSLEEAECEETFIQTTKRDDNGRFVVNLPFKSNQKALGSSLSIAVKRFEAIERRLLKDTEQYNDYRVFMQEYIDLNHMTMVCDDPTKFKYYDNSQNYVMCHHAVKKVDSSTSRTRVVFNASMPSSSGTSLNSILKVGPVVQQDLFSILLNFRKNDFILIGDLAKMYRQVLINPNQRSYQQIIWRPNPDEDLKLYQLNTVTYGTASASYLATRCLKQIAQDVEYSNPIESKIISDNFYVDDLITGSNDLSQLKLIRKNLVRILNDYGFTLRKFKSNNQQLLDDCKSASDVESDNAYVIETSESSKTLGIAYHPNSDSFKFPSIRFNDSAKINKRSILSHIAQQFDPLGLLAPITIQYKLFMQSLWQSKLDWDESLPFQLHSEWIAISKNLENIQEISIPRQAYINQYLEAHLHVFADASEKAYGAAVYVVSSNLQNDIVSNLLTSKSRVAPLKVISVPRLELCAAVLAANLGTKCAELLSIKRESIYFYSDSTIVLAWLQREPNQLQAFVGNRISEIIQLTNKDKWFHISSGQNPADLLELAQPKIFTATSDKSEIGKAKTTEDKKEGK